MVRTLLFTISCVLVAGCGTLGPATIPNDQVDYADAMSRGDARLALLNIVKLRYQDVVTFVETQTRLLPATNSRVRSISAGNCPIPTAAAPWARRAPSATVRPSPTAR